MVDPVTLGTVRPVAKSVADERAVSTPAPAARTSALRGSASLPKLVSMATDLAKGEPPIDYAKIAQLRQAIARGQYSVDADAIAHAMVGFFRTGE